MNVFDLMASLSLDTSQFESELGSAKNEADNSGSAISSAFGKVKNVIVGLGIVTAVKDIGGAIINTGTEFDTAMSQVAATMGKSTDEIEDLRDVAKEMGATTAFTATQAAEGLNYLALAGYDTEQQMAALPTVLNLASAGAMDLGSASDMVTDAMSALGIEVTQTNLETFADQLAKTASSSNTSVSQLGEALLTVGGTAKQMKGGTVEAATALGILADNGIKSAEGGTHLRNILLSLNPTTKKAREAFAELGISAYDSNGEMRDLQAVMDDINVAMEGMTDQEKQDYLSAMFNKTDLAAVNALLSTSADRWDELGTAIENSGGAAEEMAKTQLDNMGGALTLMGSALDGLKLSLWETFKDEAKGAVDGFTGIISGAQSFVDAHSEQISAAFSLLGSGISAGFQIASDAVGLVSDGISWLKEHAETEGTPINEAFTLIGDNIDKGLGAGKKIIDDTVGAFKDLWTEVNTDGTLINGVFDAIQLVVVSDFEIISGWFTTIMQLLSGDFSGAWTTVEDTIGNVVDNITGFLGEQEGLMKIWNDVTDSVDELKEDVTQTWEDIQNFIGEAVEKVKGFFDFDWEFPKPKLPHFTLNWTEYWWGSLPDIDIEWYAKAMNAGYMFDSPTVLGGRGFGDAGAEMVIGRESMMGMITEAQDKGMERVNYAVERVEKLLEAYLPDCAEGKVLYDKDDLINSTAKGMRERIQELDEVGAW